MIRRMSHIESIFEKIYSGNNEDNNNLVDICNESRLDIHHFRVKCLVLSV